VALDLCLKHRRNDIFASLIGPGGVCRATIRQLCIATDPDASGGCLNVLHSLAATKYPLDGRLVAERAGCWLSSVSQQLRDMPYSSKLANKATQVFGYIRDLVGEGWASLTEIPHDVWDAWACFLPVEYQLCLRELGWEPCPARIYQLAVARSAPLKPIWEYHKSCGALEGLTHPDLKSIIECERQPNNASQPWWATLQSPWSIRGIEGLVYVLDDWSTARLTLGWDPDGHALDVGSFLHWCAAKIHDLGASHKASALLANMIIGSANSAAIHPCSRTEHEKSLLSLILGDDQPCYERLQRVHAPLLGAIAQVLDTEQVHGVPSHSQAFLLEHWQEIAHFLLQPHSQSNRHQYVDHWCSIFKALYDRCGAAVLRSSLDPAFISRMVSLSGCASSNIDAGTSWQVLPVELWVMVLERQLDMLSRDRLLVKHKGMPRQLLEYLYGLPDPAGRLQKLLLAFSSWGQPPAVHAGPHWLSVADCHSALRPQSIDPREAFRRAIEEHDVDGCNEALASLGVEHVESVIREHMSALPLSQKLDVLHFFHKIDGERLPAVVQHAILMADMDADITPLLAEEQTWMRVAESMKLLGCSADEQVELWQAKLSTGSAVDMAVVHQRLPMLLRCLMKEGLWGCYSACLDGIAKPTELPAIPADCLEQWMDLCAALSTRRTNAEVRGLSLMRRSMALVPVCSFLRMVARCVAHKPLLLEDFVEGCKGCYVGGELLRATLDYLRAGGSAHLLYIFAICRLIKPEHEPLSGQCIAAGMRYCGCSSLGPYLIKLLSLGFPWPAGHAPHEIQQLMDPAQWIDPMAVRQAALLSAALMNDSTGVQQLQEGWPRDASGRCLWADYRVSMTSRKYLRDVIRAWLRTPGCLPDEQLIQALQETWPAIWDFPQVNQIALILAENNVDVGKLLFLQKLGCLETCFGSELDAEMSVYSFALSACSDEVLLSLKDSVPRLQEPNLRAVFIQACVQAQRWQLVTRLLAEESPEIFFSLDSGFQKLLLITPMKMGCPLVLRWLQPILDRVRIEMLGAIFSLSGSREFIAEIVLPALSKQRYDEIAQYVLSALYQYWQCATASNSEAELKSFKNFAHDIVGNYAAAGRTIKVDKQRYQQQFLVELEEIFESHHKGRLDWRREALLTMRPQQQIMVAAADRWEELFNQVQEVITECCPDLHHEADGFMATWNTARLYLTALPGELSYLGGAPDVAMHNQWQAEIRHYFANALQFIWDEFQEAGELSRYVCLSNRLRALLQCIACPSGTNEYLADLLERWQSPEGLSAAHQWLERELRQWRRESLFMHSSAQSLNPCRDVHVSRNLRHLIGVSIGVEESRVPADASSGARHVFINANPVDLATDQPEHFTLIRSCYSVWLREASPDAAMEYILTTLAAADASVIAGIADCLASCMRREMYDYEVPISPHWEALLAIPAASREMAAQCFSFVSGCTRQQREELGWSDASLGFSLLCRNMFTEQGQLKGAGEIVANISAGCNLGRQEKMALRNRLTVLLAQLGPHISTDVVQCSDLLQVMCHHGGPLWLDVVRMSDSAELSMPSVSSLASAAAKQGRSWMGRLGWHDEVLRCCFKILKSGEDVAAADSWGAFVELLRQRASRLAADLKTHTLLKSESDMPKRILLLKQVLCELGFVAQRAKHIFDAV